MSRRCLAAVAGERRQSISWSPTRTAITAAGGADAQGEDRSADIGRARPWPCEPGRGVPGSARRTTSAYAPDVDARPTASKSRKARLHAGGRSRRPDTPPIISCFSLLPGNSLFSRRPRHHLVDLGRRPARRLDGPTTWRRWRSSGCATTRSIGPATAGPCANHSATCARSPGHRRQREAAVLARLAAGEATIGEVVAVVYAGLNPALDRRGEPVDARPSRGPGGARPGRQRRRAGAVGAVPPLRSAVDPDRRPRTPS